MTADIYKVGDKVRMVKERVDGMNSGGRMDKYLGSVMTVVKVDGHYRMLEDRQEWVWSDKMIAGYAFEKELIVVHPDFEKWYTEIKDHWHNEDSAKSCAITRINQLGFGHGLEDSKGKDVSMKFINLRSAMQSNREKYTRAVLDGYTVEKEPLFYVIFPNFDTDEKYLNSYIGSEECMTADSDETSNIKTKFTEAEIRAIDERYWAFAVPVEEAD